MGPVFDKTTPTIAALTRDMVIKPILVRTKEINEDINGVPGRRDSNGEVNMNMERERVATVDEIHHESPPESYDDRDSIVTSCSVGLFEKPDSEIFLVKEEA
ncbi:hypothetical protein M8J76_002223 [Diaphorina citri]|nr:hypothetical protein M8J76_002223 [Diaphorina citri]